MTFCLWLYTQLWAGMVVIPGGYQNRERVAKYDDFLPVVHLVTEITLHWSYRKRGRLHYLMHPEWEGKEYDALAQGPVAGHTSLP